MRQLIIALLFVLTAGLCMAQDQAPTQKDMILLQKALLEERMAKQQSEFALTQRDYQIIMDKLKPYIEEEKAKQKKAADKPATP